MEAIQEIFSRGMEQLEGRAKGPLNFRLIVTPAVVIVLAIRAGLRDAREGEPAFLWALLTHPTDRRKLAHSALKDIGKVTILAFVLDTIYQLLVFRAFYVVQALIVAIACAILPYSLVRGPVTRMSRPLFKNRPADRRSALN